MRPMVDLVGRTAVVLPGTASDEVFVRSVFEEPLAQVGMHLTAPKSTTVDEHLAALDAAWNGTPLVVGGISLGAHVATRWALRHPSRCAGLLVALPAWLGPAAAAPAALAARFSASAVDRDGIESALVGVDGWLGAELSRAWHRHGKNLTKTLLAAADSTAPTTAELNDVRPPVGIAACTDDQIHPLGVAQSWATAIPRAELRTTTLAELGDDRTTLGRAAVQALLKAAT